MNKPEVIVTINSSNLGSGKISELARNGATMFRLNGAFLDLDTASDAVRIIRDSVGIKGKILLDLPGFKVRFLYLPSDMDFSKNSELVLKRSFFNYPEFNKIMRLGTILRINDGTNELVCKEIAADEIICSASSSGTIKKGKGIHIDKKSFRTTRYSLTKLDKQLIEFAKNNDIDFVGLSFVHDLDDVVYVEKLLEGTKVKCIPKIESKESIKNLNDILSNCKMVIVDRGDLAGEIGIEKVWKTQRDIIAIGKLNGVKIILATQFLTNMIRKPVPSIAEIDSLYDLIEFGIDGIQLSDETCIGDYPLKALNVIKEAFDKTSDNSKQLSCRQKGSVFWIMGPTSSGKTTISEILASVVQNCNIGVVHYDGDEMRTLMGEEHSFSKDDRLAVVKGLVHFANKSANSGLNVIVSALTASEESRKYVQDHIDNVIVIYLECDLDECIKRDAKGLYRKAINGEIDTLIGYSTPYIPPSNYDLKIDSKKITPLESVNEIIAYCLQNSLLRLR